MIINLLFNAILLLFGLLFSILPTVTLADIPFFGPEISSNLTIAVQIWNGFLESFAYARSAYWILIIVIIPFELLMLLARFFLGHRTPVNTN